jgi:tetratricopeptide (TPR) repeat protein
MHPRTRLAFPGILLVLVVLLAYLPVLRGGFIWDDDVYVTGNAALHDLGGLQRIWFDASAEPQYYPMVHTTFWLEHHLWGLNPFGYHLVNILLHASAAILLWQVLRRLRIPGAWLGAILFALHPVCVESVAWITERKNVLSAVFYFAAALSYLRFVALAEAGGRDRHRWHWYLGALVLFLAALLSKTVTCSLPAALLLVCWWKKSRVQWGDIFPLLPFFVFGVGLGLMTAWIEKHHVGAQGAEWSLTFADRCLIAGRALWFYAGKLVWPAHLTFIYPRWEIEPALWWQWLFPAAAAGVVAALWLARRRIGKGALVAVLFFAGTLGPALGFVNVYPMRYSFVADHFQYLASVGLITLCAAGLARIPRVIPVALVVLLGALTWQQGGIYRNLETLWRDTLVKNPDCWMAYNNLGDALFQKGAADEAFADFQRALEIKPDYTEAHNNLGGALLQKGAVDEAIAHFQRALEITPDNAVAHNNLGNALLQMGHADEAIAHFQRALEIKPDYTEAHNNLGNALLQKGAVDEAIAHFQRALEITPDNAVAHYNLGNALFQMGHVDEAIVHFQRALEIKPDYAEAHYNLGNALLQMGHAEEAIAHFQRALEIKPDYAVAHYNLGNALLKRGSVDEAIVHYQKALQINPDDAGALNNLAFVLATCPQASLRNGNQAVALAQRANQLTGDGNPAVLGTLAAAYAEAGQFPEAAKTAQHALQVAETQSNPALANALRSQLKLYQAGIPFHLH